MTGKGASSALSAMETQSPTDTDSAGSAGVGEVRRNAARVSALSDEVREAAIGKAGDLVEVFMAENRCHLAFYARTGGLEHKGQADRALIHAKYASYLMAELVRGRSPAQVARMERAAGLA